MMKQMKFKYVLLLVALFSVNVSWAEDNYLLTEKTYKALSAAQELLGAEKYQQADEKLTSLLNQTQAGSYDQAMVQQTLGYLYSAQGNYGKATDAFQLALASNALPEQVRHNLRFNLAQLLIADAKYKQGIALLEEWLGTQQTVQNSVYVLLASAYYRTENYRKVIDYISKAIQNDKQANEDWYRLLLSAHLSLKQYAAAIKVLETLITRYPYQKTYWDQLSALYLQQNNEMTALAVKMLASRLDLSDAQTLISLSDMYRYLQIPYKAGQLLEQGIADGVITADFDHLQRLAESWLAAREPEKAAQVLESMLAKDDSGQTHLKLGQIYVASEKWKPAEQALTKGLDWLQGKDLGQAFILLGTAYFHQQQFKQAQEQFSKAINYKEQSRVAAQWLRYIEDQLKDKEDDTTS